MHRPPHATQPARRRCLARAAGLALAAASLPWPALAAPRDRRRAAASAGPAIADDGAPDAVFYGRRDDVARFAAETADRHGLEAAFVREALERARFQPQVARLIMPAPVGSAKNWAAYRSRFVEPIRVRGGVAFWRQNEAVLARAETQYGVPAEIVVAIVGVESLYGRQMGTFRVIDALATLSFDFPPGRRDRSDLFRAELEQWFLLCRAQGLDPLGWRGSYAGAIGMPQFLPSSIRAHAVDFGGDGRIDLHADPADVVGSVAAFLTNHGWSRGMPARFDVRPPTESADRAALLGPDILPTFAAAEMTQRGAVLADAALAFDGPLALVELQNGGAAPSFVAGTANFYAITRYNQSSYYALSVVELGEAVKAAAQRA